MPDYSPVSFSGGAVEFHPSAAFGPVIEGAAVLLGVVAALAILFFLGYRVWRFLVPERSSKAEQAVEFAKFTGKFL